MGQDGVQAQAPGPGCPPLRRLMLPQTGEFGPGRTPVDAAEERRILGPRVQRVRVIR